MSGQHVESSSYVVNDEKPLFKALGLVNGYVQIGRLNRFWISALDGGRAFLKQALEQGRISAADVPRLEAEMRLAGLPEEDMPAIFAAIEKFKLPESFMPAHKFFICERCAVCPIMHGHFGGGEIYLAMRVNSKVDAFAKLMNATNIREVQVVEAIALLKQVMASRLFEGDGDAQRAFDALPMTTRMAHAQRVAHEDDLDPV